MEPDLPTGGDRPITQSVAFVTPRLKVAGWHSLPEGQVPLATVIAGMLTPAVTRSLPPSWQGQYDSARARAWISERDGESTVLLASELISHEPVGLVILFTEGPAVADGSMGLRLGYLVSEKFWGRGLATELIDGLIRWCRSRPEITSITAGVSMTNEASVNVLSKTGFVATTPHGEEMTYVHRL